MHKLRLNGMKQAKKRRKPARKSAKLTRRQMTNAMLFGTAAGAVIADYLSKNPDLMELIARSHKENVGMFFKYGK